MSKKYLPYKYRFLELLRKLSVEDYEIALTYFPEKLKVAPKTFNGWIYIKQDSATQVPTEAMLCIANFFDLPVIELYTTKPDYPLAETVINEFNEEYKIM